MNLTFIQKNRKIIYLLISIIVIIIIISLLQGAFDLNPSSGISNNINIPKGVPVINKSKFSLGALNYSGENFSIHYVSGSNSNGNIKGDKVYVHIIGINFLDPKTVLSQVHSKTNEAKKFLLNHGINPKSKNIIYTY